MTIIPKEHRHILIVPSWYFDTDSEGTFIHEHARMTALQGHQAGLIYVQRVSFFKKATTTFSFRDSVNIGISRRYYPPKLLWAIGIWKRQYVELYQQYIKKFGQPDIIHAHGYVAGMAARYLSRQASIPYILTEHATTIPSGRVAWHHVSELRQAYRDAHVLIAVSEYLKRAMQRWAGEQEIAVIYNPIDLQRFHMRADKTHRSFKQIIAIGSLEPRKNFKVLIEAMAILNKDFPVRLKLIGSGSELQALQQRATELGVMSHIDWLHHQTASEVAMQLRESDVLISSSTLETFGVVIAEALACGIPVVAAQSGAPEEYLHAGVGKIVPANDANALAIAIRYVLDHPDEFNALEIRAFAQQHFDFPVIGAKVDALYARIQQIT